MLFLFDRIVKAKYKKLDKTTSYDDFYSKSIESIKSYIVSNYLENVSELYLNRLLSDPNNHIIIHNIDNMFNTKNITGILIFHKVKNHKYYILFLSTHHKFRGMGYGKIILDEFIELVRRPNKDIQLILRTVEKSKSFYLLYGFEQIDLTREYKLFKKYELIEPDDIELLVYNIQ